MNNTQCILDALKIATDTKAFELGEGVLHRAPALFKEYFPNRKAVIVADNNTWKAAGEAVDASMREAGIPCERFLIEEEEFHADWPYVERIDEMLDRTGAVAVAVGSGVINDLCKLASFHHGQSYLCVATAASVDGYSSSGAVVSRDGAKLNIETHAPLVILADVGVLALAKRYAPSVKIHISTQASIVNYQTATAWHDLGADRVILARELSLDEIAEIRAKTPNDLEIETFGHGAMCVSYSGRCLLSNYMTGRDSNRGACAQPCRYQYALMEEKRPGEYFPVFEDEKGTYIMNSRDMCMIDHLDDLMDAGVDCLKIEGRAKSAYYAAIVTGAYRHVIDDVAQGRPADPVWRDEVEHVSHRHYSTGFFYGPPGQYYESSRYIRDWQICAVVTGCTPEGLATLSLRNKFRTGDTVEVVGPDTRPFSLTVPEMTDADGLPLFEPKTPQMTFTMPLPRPVPPMSFIRHAVDLSGK